MDNAEIINNNWYQQPWIWFVIGLLAATMMASFAMLFIASANPPDLVVESYANIEELTDQTRAQDRRAVELGLGAEVTLTPPSGTQAGYGIMVVLNSDAAISWPDKLLVKTVNSTLAELDTEAELSGANGSYTGHILLPANAYVLQIETPVADWRLSQRVVGRPASVTLSPYRPGQQ